MISKDQILATLKALGPSSPTAIANSMNVEPSAIGYHLRNMLATKSVKASGTSNNRLYALPDQKIEAAPPAPHQRRKKAKSNGKRAKSKPNPVRPRPTAAPLFLPAISEDWRLVVVQDAQPPVIFTPEQTQAIADLLLTHFEV